MTTAATGSRPPGSRRRATAALMALVVGAGALAACSGRGAGPAPAAAGRQRAEPGAGSWETWVVTAPSVVEVAPPPGTGSERARADLAEVRRLAAAPTPESDALVSRFGGDVPTKPWTDTVLDFVSRTAKNPPLSSRNYALVHAAMYDAVVTAWYWKYRYDVAPPAVDEPAVAAGPDPSYPSEHAAMAGAAARVLAALYPDQAALRLEEMADQAALSRLYAGTNTRSDVDAGLALGRAVGDYFVAYARTDGSERTWDGRRPPGIGRGPAFWEPPPGTVSPPTDPAAATWRPWVMSSPSQFRPGPPAPYGSPELRAQATEVLEARRNLTPEQRRAVDFYAGVEGSSLPAGVVASVSEADLLGGVNSDLDDGRLTLPRTVRAMALVTVAMADAGIAAWDTKYTYWSPRPENAIRDLGLDPDFTPVIPTPRFPAYVSGSATYAGAAEAVMSYLFPERAATFRERAETQAQSRLWAGIHYRADAAGLDMGRSIGQLVVARARGDGADADLASGG